VYCGFSSRNKISRVRLKADEAATELANIAKSGRKDVLILTGESAKKSSVLPISYSRKSLLTTKTNPKGFSPSTNMAKR
ncbi:MAG: hypothetical protein ACFNYA_09185, partial [Capnocytophaga granulosa]